MIISFLLILFIHREGNSSTTRPLQSEIISFVDKSITTHILQRWLNATNMVELKTQNTLCTLQSFVQRVFMINYYSRNTDETKSLDKMTMGIAVPSRNGKNIASNLQL